jgi:hypothetical protein
MHRSRPSGVPVIFVVRRSKDMSPYDALVAKINYAFQNVENIYGTTLSDCIIADGYGDDESRKDAMGKDERRKWKNIRDEWIEKYDSVFCFADSCGAKFLVAPYMIWAAKNARAAKSCTSDFLIYFLDRIESNQLFLDSLDNDQKGAIRAFLYFMKNQMNGYCDEVAIISALDKWKCV